MRLPSVVLSAIACLLASSSCSNERHSRSVQERIGRVENGLLPAVVVRGQRLPRATLWEVMEHYHVPGVSVAVINDGRLEWARGYGVKEIGGAPVDTATLFLAGHIGQSVAAIAALELVEQGRLGLDEDVNDYLTSWHIPNNEFTVSEAVTLRRILSHTSGLSVPTLVGYSADGALPTTLHILDGVPPATNQPVRVLDTPGSRQRYSLGGYVVLQQLVEDITGTPYAEFVRSTVLVPLDMASTHHTQPLTERLTANAASGYLPANERVQGRWRVYPELAALGMWTTPSDLARLALTLQRAYSGGSDELLFQTSVEGMFSQQFENRGLGFEVGGEGEWRFFRLEGHGNNYLSELYGYVSHGMGAVVMTNSSNGEAVKAHVLRAVAAEYGWPDFVPEEVDVARLPDETLEELEGRYSYRGRDRILVVEEGRIVQRTDGDREEVLLPLSQGVLVSVSFGYRYAVERDSTGTVIGLTLVLQDTPLFTYEKVD